MVGVYLYQHQQSYTPTMSTHKGPLCYRKTYPPPLPPPSGHPGKFADLLGKVRVDYYTQNHPPPYNPPPYPVIRAPMPRPTCLEDVLPDCTDKAEARKYDHYMKWYENNGWSDKDLARMRRRIVAFEASKPGRNAHLDNVLSKYSGKTAATAVVKVKPLRVRFKQRVVKPIIDVNEGKEEDEGEEEEEAKEEVE